MHHVGVGEQPARPLACEPTTRVRRRRQKSPSARRRRRSGVAAESAYAVRSWSWPNAWSATGRGRGRGVAGQGVHDRQLEGQRLARSGAGADDDVVPSPARSAAVTRCDHGAVIPCPCSAARPPDAPTTASRPTARSGPVSLRREAVTAGSAGGVARDGGQQFAAEAHHLSTVPPPTPPGIVAETVLTAPDVIDRGGRSFCVRVPQSQDRRCGRGSREGVSPEGMVVPTGPVYMNIGRSLPERS